MKEKLYFRDVESTICVNLQTHLEDAEDEELTEVTLFEAILDNHNVEHIFCGYMGEVTERQECKKAVCSHYESKSGRGVCKHRGDLYRFGKEITFKVE